MELGYHEIIDQILTAEAEKRNINPDVLKAIAWKESDWLQFDDKGKPIIGKETSDIGIMQINPVEYRRRGLNQGKSLEEINEEVERLKKDQMYKIEGGADWVSTAMEEAKSQIKWEDYEKERKNWKPHEYDVKYRQHLQKKPWLDKIKEEREYYSQWE